MDTPTQMSVSVNRQAGFSINAGNITTKMHSILEYLLFVNGQAADDR